MLIPPAAASASDLSSVRIKQINLSHSAIALSMGERSGTIYNVCDLSLRFRQKAPESFSAFS